MGPHRYAFSASGPPRLSVRPPDEQMPNAPPPSPDAAFLLQPPRGHAPFRGHACDGPLPCAPRELVTSAGFFSELPMSEEVTPEDVFGPPPPSTRKKAFLAYERQFNDPEVARQAGLKGAAARTANYAEKRRKAEAARADLSLDFLTDLKEMWGEHGKTILARAAFAHPEKVAKIMADLMPKQMEIKGSAIQDIEDDRLADLIDALSERLGRGVEGVAGSVAGGSRATIIDAEAVEVPALPKAE